MRSIKTVSPLQAVQLLTSTQRAQVLDVRTVGGVNLGAASSTPGAHPLTVSVPWLARAPVAVDAGERVSFRNAAFVDDVLFAVGVCFVEHVSPDPQQPTADLTRPLLCPRPQLRARHPGRRRHLR